ncbi:outer membrane biosynthesis protein TonB [Virgibacillus natechei]|uniref:Outer membrane biosynthesis protein TonB n=1 Tax=Virgibacillus natechei TaxID=1216297 RepID=A0ABS4IKK0_9BACI|nr:hypothetical protein [Virgibacillus natechei]MBP1971493.1 outer membrane biosynthesis protein TonB [Virgibacillus natechei]UZD12546.1 hypothetical protein OLD84_16830 [Virgibacillus natechei]
MNRIINSWNENKGKAWIIVLFLILFFPVGLYLMWRYSEWGKKPKWVITAFFILLLIINRGSDEETEKDLAYQTDEVRAENAAEKERLEQEEAEEQVEEEQLEQEEAEKQAEKERLEQEEAEEQAEEEQREQEEAEKQAEEERLEQEEAEKQAEEERLEQEEAEKQAEEERLEQEEAEKQAEEEQELTPEEEIENAIRGTNAKIKDIIITTGTETFVSVTFEGRDNLTLNSVKSGIYRTMSNILFELKELDYNFIDITLMAELPLVDQYGNEELSVVIRGNYDNNTLENINPENKYIVEENIPNLAIEWYEHPTMQE